MVHLSIGSRVFEHVSAAATLPMPEGMELSVSPTDFMAYPKETYYPTITVKTTAATPPGEYVFRYHETWEGMFYGDGWFDVIVTG